MANLTPRQQRFVAEYLIDLNGTRAAVRAGYSEATAAEGAVQLLRNIKVAEEIEKAMAERAERTEITADRVLKEYARIAFYDPSRIFRVDEDGLPQIDLSNATEEDWRVLGEMSNTFEVGRGNDGGKRITKTGKVKLHCKLVALGQVGRHLGIFNDKQVIKHEFEELSDAELIERAKGLLGGVAASGPGESAT